MAPNPELSMRVTSLRSRTIRPFSGILLLTSRFRKSEVSTVKEPRHFTTVAPSRAEMCRWKPEVEIIAGSDMKLPRAKVSNRDFCFRLPAAPEDIPSCRTPARDFARVTRSKSAFNAPADHVAERITQVADRLHPNGVLSRCFRGLQIPADAAEAQPPRAG